MLSKNNIKYLKKNKRNKRKNYKPKLYNVLGVPVHKVIRWNELISSTSGDVTLQFNSGGTNYFPLSNFSSATDFTPYLSTHALFKMFSVTVKVTRIVPESILATIYPNGIPNIYIAYYPTYNGDTLSTSAITNQESAITVMPLNFNAVVKKFYTPNLPVTRFIDGQFYAINLQEWNDMHSSVAINGQLSIASNLTSAATATKSLYELEISAEFAFCCPI